MNFQNQIDLVPIEFAELKKVRQQLSHFVPTEGSLEVVFYLPNGDRVQVPINRKAKIELLSKEVRNYLAEEQLSRQEKVNG